MASKTTCRWAEHLDASTIREVDKRVITERDGDDWEIYDMPRNCIAHLGKSTDRHRITSTGARERSDLKSLPDRHQVLELESRKGHKTRKSKTKGARNFILTRRRYPHHCRVLGVAPVGRIRREWTRRNDQLATEYVLDNSGIAMESLISPWLRHCATTFMAANRNFEFLEAGCGNSF